MVDLDNHRIIDMIELRESGPVAEWLKTFPNLQIVSSDGSQTYASALTISHPQVLQISDRFHLLKNLSEAVIRYINRTYPSRLEILATISSKSPEMQALYDTRNRAQRICFAKKSAKKDLKLKRSLYYYILLILLLENT